MIQSRAASQPLGGFLDMRRCGAHSQYWFAVTLLISYAAILRAQSPKPPDRIAYLTPGQSSNAIASSPDSKVFGVAEGEKIRVFDFATGSLLLEFPFSIGEGSIHLTAAKPGLLLVDNGAGQVELWSWPQRKLIHAFREKHTTIDAVTLSPDGRRVYLAEERQLLEYDVQADLTTAIATLPDTLTKALDLGPAGSTLVSIGYSGKAVIWDIASRRALRELDVAPNAVSGRLLDGKRLLEVLFYSPHAGLVERKTQVWDLASGDLLWELPGAVVQVVQATGGERLVVLNPSKNCIDVYDTAGNFKSKVKEYIADSAVRPRAEYLAAGGNSIVVWGMHLATDRNLAADFDPVRLGLNPVNAAISPDGRWLAGDSYPDIGIWELKGPPAAAAASPAPAPAGSAPLRPEIRYPYLVPQSIANQTDSLSFTPDGLYVIADDTDGSFAIFDAATGRVIKSLTRKSLYSVFGTDDHRLFAALGDDRRRLDLSDAMTGAVLYSADPGKESVSHVAVSPKGDYLAMASGLSPIRLVHLPTGHVSFLQSWKDGEVHGDVGYLTFLRDGATLFAGRNWHSETWDVRTASLLEKGTSDDAKILPEAGSGANFFVVRADWPRDGMLTVTRAADGREASVPLLNPTNGIQQFPLAAALSPDGSRVRELSRNGWLLEWDTVSGRLTRRIRLAPENAGASIAAAFDASGERLATAWFDGASHVQVRTVAAPERTLDLGFSRVQVDSIAFEGSTHNLLVAASAHGVLLSKWEASSGNVLFQTFRSAAGGVFRAKLSADGTFLLQSCNSRLTAWETATARKVFDVTLPGGYMFPEYSTSRTGDRTWIATSRDLYLIPRAHPVPEHRDAGDHYSSTVVASPAGAWAARMFPGVTRLFQADSSSTAKKLPWGPNVLAFSPDDRFALTGYVNHLSVIQIPSGREVWKHTNLTMPRIGLFSPRGDFVVAGDYQQIAIRDAATGKMRRTLAGPDSEPLSLAISEDGTLLAALCRDGLVRLWDVATGELRATLLVAGNGEWSIASPEGLFDGSPEAWAMLRWRLSAAPRDTSPIEIFFSDFFKPGLLAEILSGGHPLPAKDLRKIDRRQPRVQLALDGQTGGRDPAARIRITVAQAPPAPAQKQSAGSGARDLRLFRNGSLVKAWHGDLPLNSSGEDVVEAEVPVAAGLNRWTAYAFNRANVKSEDATLNLNVSGPAQPGTAYLMTIGIDSYENPRFNLRYAAADADALSQSFALAQKSIGRYARVEQIALRNRSATKQAVLAALNQIKMRARPEDAVIVFFAGHGAARGDHFYLIPYDLGYSGDEEALTPGAELDKLLAHSISDQDLQNAFEEVNASTVLLLIDACQSGKALDSEQGRVGPLNNRGLAQLAYEKGMYVLAAAQSGQAAVESSRLQHGVLTYSLLEALRSAVADSVPTDGDVTVREWFDYAVRRVPELGSEMSASRGFLLDAPPGQRPRAFYRREVSPHVLIVYKKEQPANQRP
jgi:WD40 repeat protein